jgi:hypothetical protein
LPITSGGDQPAQDIVGGYALLHQSEHEALDRRVVAVEHGLPDRHEHAVLQDRCGGGGGWCGLLDDDRTEAPGLEWHPAFALDALADTLQPREHRLWRHLIGDTDYHASARCDRAKQLIETSFEFRFAGLGQHDRGGDTPEQRELPAPALVVLRQRDSRHRRRADRFSDVHAGIADQVHQPEVLSVRVAHQQLACGGECAGGLAYPRLDLLLEIRRVGEHVVEVRAPVHDLRRGLTADLQYLVVQRFHSLHQGPQFLLVILVVDEELRGIDQVALDLLHRRGTVKMRHNRHAVVAHLLVGPVIEALEVGHDVHVLE